MRRITIGLAATAAGIALVVGVKAESAGAPRSALGVSDSGGGGGVRIGGGPGVGSNHGAPTARPTASAGSSTGPSGGPSTVPSSGPAAGAAATPAGRSGRFTGAAVDTRYGTVQVQAVLTAGRLTDVVVLQETDGGRSQDIDSFALPVLRAEALKAQGADIDVVSGATYTSAGYARSLQAALDAAGRG
ncbi:FMN-binding protein [Streptacidiphilus cavernicola]|uniref:FMN-binding protein n=1 Tax=Streptacidiphilus cavernicola TaxID=3342716 RepID=A0ABV6VWU8_9ACTN